MPAPSDPAPALPLPAVWVSLYYLAFYVVMTGIFALCIYVLMCTIDPYTPDYQDQLKSPGNRWQAQLRRPLGEDVEARAPRDQEAGAGVQHQGRSPGGPLPPRQQEASRPRAGVSSKGAAAPRVTGLRQCPNRGKRWGDAPAGDRRAAPLKPGDSIWTKTSACSLLTQAEGRQQNSGWKGAEESSAFPAQRLSVCHPCILRASRGRK